jgi:hypothetical protein
MQYAIALKQIKFILAENLRLYKIYIWTKHKLTFMRSSIWFGSGLIKKENTAETHKKKTQMAAGKHRTGELEQCLSESFHDMASVAKCDIISVFETEVPEVGALDVVAIWVLAFRPPRCKTRLIRFIQLRDGNFLMYFDDVKRAIVASTISRQDSKVAKLKLNCLNDMISEEQMTRTAMISDIMNMYDVVWVTSPARGEFLSEKKQQKTKKKDDLCCVTEPGFKKLATIHPAIEFMYGSWHRDLDRYLKFGTYSNFVNEHLVRAIDMFPADDRSRFIHHVGNLGMVKDAKNYAMFAREIATCVCRLTISDAPDIATMLIAYFTSPILFGF